MAMRKLGWKPQKADSRDYKVASVLSEEALADCYDLSPWFPPCYDQGDTNACTGYSCAGAYHYLAKAQGIYDFVPSSMFVYYGAREYESDVDQDNGAELRDALKVMTKLGVPSETDWPSLEANLHNKPPPEVYTIAQRHMLLQYAAIPDAAEDEDKKRRLLSCLSHRIPVVFGFRLYRDISVGEPAKTGVVPYPRNRSNAQGGHAVVLVGYDPKKRLYKFRNSWGPDWGQNGYGYLSERYVHDPDLAGDFWAMFTVQKGAIA